MINNIKNKLGVKLIAYGIKMVPQYFNQMLNARASDLAYQAVIKYFEREGLLHCEFCANRFGLVKIDGKYLCPKHKESIEKSKKEILVK